MRLRNLIFTLLFIGLAALCAIEFSYVGDHLLPPIGRIAPTRPITTLPAAPAPPRSLSYGEVVASAYPNFPSTQPLSVNVDIEQAAHLLLHDPIYVCPRGDLWITRTDASAASEVLKSAAEDWEHVLSERVVYVHWAGVGPTLITQAGQDFYFVTVLGRTNVPWHRGYNWQRALSWGEQIIVPTDTGVSVITPGDKPAEDFHSLTSTPGAVPQIAFDGQGFLAWIPGDASTTQPTAHVSRYVDGAWHDLTDPPWVSSPLQLIPLWDGSVIQISLAPDGTSQLSSIMLQQVGVNAGAIDQLINQLDDDDPAKRADALAKLAQYGKSAWPVLESRSDDPSPNISTALKSLLRGRTQPSLGGMELVGNHLTLVSRYPDGGVLLYAAEGVKLPWGNAQADNIVAPAYLSVAPGQAVQLLAPGKVKDIKPTDSLIKIGRRWIWTAPTGPRIFVDPDEYKPLLRAGEFDFTQLVAIDRRGRWILKNPHAPDDAQTLVLDPTLADPLPRLAIWTINHGGQVGWDDRDFPVVTRDNVQYILGTDGWIRLDSTTRTLHTHLNSGSPATTQAVPPLLVMPDATYFDGRQGIQTKRSNSVTTWELPEALKQPASASKFSPNLAQTPSAIFLCNVPDTLIKLRETPAKSGQFEVDGVFTGFAPGLSDILRMWTDPAGRIDIAYQQTRLLVIFPTGQVPPKVGALIMSDDMKRIDGTRR